MHEEVVRISLWSIEAIEIRFWACNLIDPGVVHRQARINTRNVDVTVFIFRIDAKRYLFTSDSVTDHNRASFVEIARSRLQLSWKDKRTRKQLLWKFTKPSLTGSFHICTTYHYRALVVGSVVTNTEIIRRYGHFSRTQLLNAETVRLVVITNSWIIMPDIYSECNILQLLPNRKMKPGKFVDWGVLLRISSSLGQVANCYRPRKKLVLVPLKAEKYNLLPIFWLFIKFDSCLPEE